MRSRACIGAALLLAHAAIAAEPAQIGDMTETHDPVRWLRPLLARTPSILPRMPASKFDPVTDKAIAHYDRVIALTDDPAVLAESIRRAAYLRVRDADMQPDRSSEARLREAVALYERLLRELPDDPANDRAWYQLARAQELLGNSEASAVALSTLTRRYPESTLAASARFRAGELAYRSKQFEVAATHYEAVIAKKYASPQRQFAMYKYGWALYQQGRYEEAIAPLLSVLETADPQLAADTLHAVSLAFVGLGGGDRVDRYFRDRGSEPRFMAELLLAVAAQQEKRQRDADAMATYAAFVERYGPSIATDATRAAAVRRHAESLARYHHAQRQPESLGLATTYYERLLGWFPDDPQAGTLRTHHADALLEAGRLREAAEQYAKVAFASAPSDRKLEATIAAANGYHALGDWDAAMTLAQRVLDDKSAADPELRARMLGLVADAHFEGRRFAEAERGYGAFLSAAAPSNPQRGAARERLAETIYRQAEAARVGGDLRLAATTFRRVGIAVPDASIRATADYDAAAAYLAAQDWRPARQALEEFRGRFPTHALIAEVDKKLAVASERDQAPSQAAQAYARIARRESETTETRQNAALLAAQLYDRAGEKLKSAQAYEHVLASFVVAPEQRAEIQQHLAQVAIDERGDERTQERWLREVIATDQRAGDQRSDRTRTLAAQALLTLGRRQAQAARAIALQQPLAKSLARRRVVTEAAIATLVAAADYRLADVTPAASYEVGRLYSELADALLRSERPRQLKGLALEQYDVLLEEQSDPFTQKAIDAHETNLGRLRQPLWNASIRASADALSTLVPGRYGKREINEVSYDSLR